ncbi:hypothetical protein DVR12_14805 [Chitinophaga silvatica]|uniref:Peptidase M48 domain-containing protein n=1 Tax=Chitinophaga silvatica TaxID=2282649 RepID=A0A3E1Y922_9BACT|nr:M48 family metallopeptidase [Chitinophaga silvatica]RFS21918.1 hypothetical protein DVR12_14805 [Chitinophaga silvatica]
MYPGNYFDNQTAALTAVDIQIHSEHLDFHFLEDNTRKISWLYSEINAETFNKRVLKIKHPTEGGLEITDPECIQAFTSYYPFRQKKSLYGWVIRNGNKAAISLAALLLGIFLIIYFLVLPFLGDVIAKQLPKSFDRELGDLARSTIHEKIDTTGSDLLTRFAKQINWNSKDTFTFEVAKSSVINAYALPGGHIVVYEELLKKINTKEELAALLSHEVSHVEYRHSVRKLCKDMSTSIIVSAFFSNIGSVTSTLSSQANTLSSLTYSREYEKEADIEGLAILRKNKIDQQGMVKLLDILSSIDQKIKIPTFLSTHPLTKDRINYVKERIKESPAPYEENPELTKIFKQLKELYHS